MRAAGETIWHVHKAGRFVGTIAEIGGGFEATRLVDGAARTNRFPDRDAAARWLTKITLSNPK